MNKFGIEEGWIAALSGAVPVNTDDNPNGSLKPKTELMRGFRMSASIRTTRAAVWVREIARLTAVTVFPSLGAALVTRIDFGG